MWIAAIMHALDAVCVPVVQRRQGWITGSAMLVQ